MLAHVRLRHDLHLHLPAREIAKLDGIEQIFLRGLTRAADDLGGFLVGPVLVALLGLEVELHPVPLA